jgi:hypothetical protein
MAVDPEIDAIVKDAHNLQYGFWKDFNIQGVRLSVKRMAHKFKPKTQRYFTQILGLALNNMRVGEHTLFNVLVAAIRRWITHKGVDGVIRPVIKPKPGIFQEEPFTDFVKMVAKLVLDRIHEQGEMIPWSHEKYVSLAPAHKQALYEATLEQSNEKQKVLTRSDSIVKAQTKAEKKVYKYDLVDRLFMPRPTIFHIFFGSFIKSIEHQCYESISDIYSMLSGSKLATVTKGMNMIEKGTLIYAKSTRFNKPRHILLDVSHFDKHVSVKIMREVEHMIYKLIFPNNRELAKLLTETLSNYIDIFTRDGFRVKWTNKGGRMSGDVNTALGNVIVMCACIYYYARKYVTKVFEFTDEGDDCFPTMEEHHSGEWDKLTEVFKDLGFTLRVEAIVDDIHKIQYCQASPICIGGVWRTIRTIDSVFSKDTACLTGKTNEEFLHWLYEVGTNGAIINDGVPVFSALYAKYKEWGKRGTLTAQQKNDMFYGSLRQLSSGIEYIGMPITEDNRVEFYLMTGVMPEHQLMMEKEISELPGLVFCEGPLDLNAVPSQLSSIKLIKSLLDHK